MFDANIFYPAALLNADDDERQKPENWIVIGWLPIYDDSKAKKIAPQARIREHHCEKDPFVSRLLEGYFA